MTLVSLLVVILWVAFSSLILIFAALGIDPVFRLYYSNIMQIIAPVLAAIFCYRTAINFPVGNPMRKVWGLLGSGVLAWGIGAILFISYPLLKNGNETPYPYLSDIGYLSLVPLVASALILYKSRLGVDTPLWGKIIAVFLLSGGLIISLLANWRSLFEQGAFLAIVSFCYIFFDPILLAITVLVASTLYGGSAGTAWWYVLGGLILYFIGNQSYTYLVMTGQYASGSPIDTLWVLGFGMIAVAAIITYSLFKDAD